MSAWWSVAPAFVVLLAIVLLPGTAMAYAVGLRGLVAWGLAPSLGFTSLTLSPIAAHLLSVDWSPLLLVVFSLAWVLASWFVGLALRLGWQASRRPRPPTARPDSPRTLLVAAGSVLMGAIVILAASLPSIGTPGDLVDSTDVVAHLNRIRAFLDSGSFSSIGPPVSYPSGFHDLAASTMQVLPGLDIVTAANLTALAGAAVFFPLGCVVLARLVLGRRAVVLVAAGLASAAVTTFPYLLMGWGVLWPNLLATALLPGILGPALLAAGVVGGSAHPGGAALDPVMRSRIGLGVLAAVPGFTLVHPNGLVSLVMIVVLGLLTNRAGRATRTPGRSRRRALLDAGLLVVGSLAVLVVLPRVSQQVANTMSYRPSSTTGVVPALGEVGLLSLQTSGRQLGLPLLALVGVVVCARRRELRWVLVVEAFCLLLYVLAAGPRTVAGDLLTGYWYNDKYRLAALAAIPLVLLLVAAVAGLQPLLARAGKRWGGSRRSGGSGRFVTDDRAVRVTTGVAALLVLVAVSGGLSHSVASTLISNFYHPPEPEAVLLTAEQDADLGTLAALIPADVVTADVPANGSGLLYALHHRKVLFDSLLLNPDRDSALIGLHLRDVTTRTDVCDALRRTNVQYAITGLVTYRLNLAERTTGMDDLRGVAGLVRIATAGRYTLYRIDACGFGVQPNQP